MTPASRPRAKRVLKPAPELIELTGGIQMGSFIQDLRYGARMLLKQKGLTAIAVLSLALGIGANTALFSVVDAMLLKKLPVKEPDRLALFGAGRPADSGPASLHANSAAGPWLGGDI